MRKQSAAARFLPFQIIPETIGVDFKQHQALLACEMLVERAAQMIGSGEMNEAVAAIIWRTVEAAFARGFREGGFGADFVEGTAHRGSTPERNTLELNNITTIFLLDSDGGLGDAPGPCSRTAKSGMRSTRCRGAMACRRQDSPRRPGSIRHPLILKSA